MPTQENSQNIVRNAEDDKTHQQKAHSKLLKYLLNSCGYKSTGSHLVILSYALSKVLEHFKLVSHLLLCAIGFRFLLLPIDISCQSDLEFLIFASALLLQLADWSQYFLAELLDFAIIVEESAK